MIRPTPKVPSSNGPQSDPRPSTLDDGEAEHQRSRDEEIRDLHPALIAQAERANEIMPHTITGTCRPFDQEYQDKEQGANCAAHDQEFREPGVVLYLIVFCKHNFFLFLYLIDLMEEVYPGQLCLTSV